MINATLEIQMSSGLGQLLQAIKLFSNVQSFLSYKLCYYYIIELNKSRGPGRRHQPRLPLSPVLPGLHQCKRSRSSQIRSCSLVRITSTPWSYLSWPLYSAAKHNLFFKIMCVLIWELITTDRQNQNCLLRHRESHIYVLLSCLVWPTLCLRKHKTEAETIGDELQIPRHYSPPLYSREPR